MNFCFTYFFQYLFAFLENGKEKFVDKRGDLTEVSQATKS